MQPQKNLTTVGFTLGILWCGHFLVDMLIGFWSVYKTMAGMDLAIAGLIAGICPFIGEGMQILFGTLGDKGYRKIMLLLGIAATCGDAFLAYTGNPVFLFLFYLLTNIGSGAFHPTAVAIASSLTASRKGLFVSIFASGGSLGLALSHFIYSNWHAHFGNTTFYLAIPSLLLFCYILTVQMPGAQPVPASPGRRFGISAMKKIFKCKELVTLYASQVCVQSVMWGAIFLLPDVLWSKGYDYWICFGAGHFAFVIGGGLMVIPGGYLSDKYSARTVLLVAHILGCGLFYFFLFTPLLPSYMLLLILFALGATMGVGNPVAVGLGNKIMPSRPGLVSAFLMGMVWCISEGIGPGGGGLLTKLFTENAPTYALAIIGIFYVSGAIITVFLPTTVLKEFDIETA